ncbi:MAG: nucleoside-diphosphate sugar epimerase/dehydratase [Pseudomonadota bacterium]|nr:nucleoside-diphosphate sugar epimerase/dehydratase [Pseudomonadota bacterium]
MKLIHRISSRGLIVYAHDIFMSGIAFILAMYLRLGDNLQYYASDTMYQATFLFIAISAVAFFFSGLYQGVWRYASINDLLAITRAVTLTVLVFLLIMFLLTRFHNLPRSVIPIAWFSLMALLGGPRFIYRLFKDRQFNFLYDRKIDNSIAVLLAGDGDGAELFIRGLRRSSDANYYAVGLVSENARRIGRKIHGVEVLGTIDDLDDVVKSLNKDGIRPQRLILTRDDMNGTLIRSLLDRADKLGMTLARVPRVTDFKSGTEEKAIIRPIAVEDLLGRPQTTLDRDDMKALINGTRVLITGAGGSIGSELVRQVCALNPLEVMLLDHSEHALYSIDRETLESWPTVIRHAVIADIRNAVKIQNLFECFRPNLVFHAAAMKHVPLVESNIIEGTSINIIGTVNIANSCISTGVGTMVQISTDKAVNPTSVMGATKRVAESYCQALDLQRGGNATDQTRFVTVRFGNVLGSTGSVVPLFQRQLSEGGPITVTHPEMTRFFMTVKEAVELVLQASTLDSPYDNRVGKIFVLDMGEPIRIIDLAKQMIRLAGLKPEYDIKIDIIGIRPGEKLFEEIFHGTEPPVATQSPGILLATPRPGNIEDLSISLADIENACKNNDVVKVQSILRSLVPEYDTKFDAIKKSVVSK